MQKRENDGSSIHVQFQCIPECIKLVKVSHLWQLNTFVIISFVSMSVSAGAPVCTTGGKVHNGLPGFCVYICCTVWINYVPLAGKCG